MPHRAEVDEQVEFGTDAEQDVARVLLGVWCRNDTAFGGEVPGGTPALADGRQSGARHDDRT